MGKFSNEVWIDAPKEKVWDILADFGNVYIFNPTVPNSYLTSNQKTGVGTTRHCDLSLAGASIEERIVEWDDGKSMKVEIYDGKKAPPFKTAIAGITLQEENGGTRVRASLDFTLKGGPLGALMDKFMVTPKFSPAFAGLLAGLKHHVETGEVVEGPKGLNFEHVAATA